MDEGTPPDTKPRASGTIQLFDNSYLVQRAVAPRRVLACFDGQLELVLDLDAFTPGKTISFTCSDASALLSV